MTDNTNSYDHPFKEFHADAEIGCLMWRISCRSAAASDLQDGSLIIDVEKRIEADREELREKLQAYHAAV